MVAHTAISPLDEKGANAGYKVGCGEDVKPKSADSSSRLGIRASTQDAGRSCQVDRHVVSAAKRLATGRAFAVAILDEIVDTFVAEDVAARLEHVVANVRVADGADGKALSERLARNQGQG